MIKLLVLDVDGTMTDGGVFIDGSGNEFKRFDVRDGLGIARLHRTGVKTMILSGRHSEATSRRAMELGIHMVYQDVKNKLEILERAVAEQGLTAADVAYMGDDINDAECIRWAGKGIAPSDAAVSAKEAADLVTSARGGYGAVREAIDRLFFGSTEEKNS